MQERATRMYEHTGDDVKSKHLRGTSADAATSTKGEEETFVKPGVMDVETAIATPICKNTSTHARHERIKQLLQTDNRKSATRG